MSYANITPSLPSKSRVIQVTQTMTSAMNWRKLKPPIHRSTLLELMDGYRWL